jgi:hypothetical protein
MGQNFLIDNRSGASGNIGTEAVVRAPADGYTLLLVGSQDFTNATVFEKLNFNFIRDTGCEMQEFTTGKFHSSAPVASKVRYRHKSRRGGWKIDGS